MNTKVCTSCGREKPKSKFEEARKVCNRCRYLKKTLRLFGLTLDDFEDALILGGGVCEICKQPPGPQGFMIDHKHATNEFRGLLCHPCNSSIGLMKDKPESLRAAAAYLENRP